MRVGAMLKVVSAGPAQSASPVGRLASLLEEKRPSSLERARRALLNAREELERQRDERVEEALPGYRALCARRNSYEEQRSVNQECLEQFQALNGCRDRLLAESVSAGAADRPEGMPSLEEAQHTGAPEEELAAVDREMSALVERMNRYTGAQRQYAAYLEKTGQDGYAAFVYRDWGGLTRENFLPEMTERVSTLEQEEKDWNGRVWGYCKQRGLTADEIERYLQEKNRLGGAYAAARQRYLELLDAAGSGGLRRSVDRVELGGGDQKPVPLPDDAVHEAEMDCGE